MMMQLNSRNKKWMIGLLLLAYMVTACGRRVSGDAEAEIGTEAEVAKTETGAEAEAAKTETGAEAEAAKTETGVEAAEAKQGKEDVVAVYTTEGLKYSDEEIPALYVDDLSLLVHMGQTDCSYAYRDGRVYYRQYHEDSFVEGALWAGYSPIAGTDKEIVCIDAEGKRTVLFSDKGYGNIYLIGDRFYMVEAEEAMDYIVSRIYSVDIQGQNRVDYGYGKIYAFDMDRNILILWMQSENTWKGTYFALDCMSGEMIPLIADTYGFLRFWAYQDGWCYFDVHWEEEWDICRVVAVSLEGEQKEIIALSSNNETEDNYGYTEEICRMGVDGDRVYIVFGGYAGTGHFFQGGRMIAVKLDSSDYRAVECYDDSYFVCHDAGRTLVYLPHYSIDDEKEYEATVWDVEANMLFPSNFPRELIYEQQAYSVLPYQKHAESRPLCILKNNEETNIYALPDDSGRIVPVAMQVNDAITPRGGEEVDYIAYQHLYYADGFLYFEVQFNIYDREYSIGWRDGYRRLQTDVYRLKLDENVIELLYSY